MEGAKALVVATQEEDGLLGEFACLTVEAIADEASERQVVGDNPHGALPAARVARSLDIVHLFEGRKRADACCAVEVDGVVILTRHDLASLLVGGDACP